MTRVLVVDASVVVDLIIRFRPDPLEQLLFASGVVLAAPALLDIEVLQVLRRLDLGKALPRDHDSVAIFRSIRIHRYPHESLLNSIWQQRSNLTAYDAAYVVLAHHLNAELVTRDLKLARVPTLTARVITP